MTEAEIEQYLRKKDFYDILGVTKDSSETEIKKAYRKLALKFHPDKNQLPKSKDVFKKISQAYDCLSNADKKAFYDRTGNEEPQQHYQHYQEQYGQQFDPDDIFSFFFGGNPFDQNIRNHRNRQQQQNNGQQHRAQANQQYLPIFQLLPLLVIFLPVIMQMFETPPAYSLEKSYVHPQSRATKNLELRYYVNDDFFNNAKNDKKYISRIERQIESDYIRNLRTECYYATINKKKLTDMANYYSSGSRSNMYYEQQAKKINMQACYRLDQYERDRVDLSIYY